MDKPILKRIGTETLTVGMYVRGFAVSETAEAIMLMNSIRIGSVSEVSAFKAKGYRYAFIVEGEGLAGSAMEPVGAVAFRERTELPMVETSKLLEISGPEPEEVDIVDRVAFEEEVGKAKEIKAEAGDMVARFMHEARSGKSIDGVEAEGVVDSMIRSMFNNQDALLSLSRLKDRDNYTFGHSINVSIISLALGRRLGLSYDQLGLLGLGAMLHDIGKMKVPDEILNKPGFLTDYEYGEMKNHVTYGAAILGSTRHISREAIDIALQHHERYDGKGYVRGLIGEEIHPYGRIVGLADAYDAITTDRVYNNGRNPTDALRRIYGAKGAHFDPVMADKFIRCIGIYPIGSKVQLDDGAIAEVMTVNRDDFLRPVVTVLCDAQLNRHEKPFDIDLASARERSILTTVSFAFGG